MFGQIIKVFTKNRVCFITYLLMLIMSNVYLGFYIKKYVVAREPDYTCYDILMPCQWLSIIAFLLFLVISYELLSMFNIDGINEISLLYLRRKQDIIITVLLFICALVYYFTIALWVLFALSKYDNADAAVYINAVKYVTLYFLIADMIAILEGTVIATVKTRGKAFVIIAITAIMVTPVLTMIVDSVSTLKFDLYAFSKWFYILPQNITWGQNPYCQYYVDWYDYFLEMMWLGLLLLILILNKSKPGLTKSISTALLILVIAVAGFFGSHNNNGFVNAWDVNRSAAGHCYLYYETHPNKEEAAGYEISEYDMRLRFNDKMYADVAVSIDDDSLSDYRFTLYHQYKIKSITNANGEKLEYDRDSDYIDVRSSGDMRTISFSYCGDAAGFYSAGDNVYLPGYFCYYPRAGYQSVYDYDNRIFTYNELNETLFHVIIDSDTTIYCNLPEKKKREFSGKSNGLQLVSGELAQMTYKDVRVIYPYAGMNMLYSSEAVKTGVDRMIDSYDGADYDVSGKTVFLSPRINSSRSYTFYSDFMELKDFEDGIEGPYNYYKYYQKNRTNLPECYFIQLEDVDYE